MQQRKPKILLVNEASFLHTGYSVYGKEVLSRLYDTNKYEIAELASYGPVTPTLDEIESYTRQFGIPQMFDLPWRYYGNAPLNQKEHDEYNSSNTNQFGEWRFERTCLDFKPDIVIDIRDWWMMEFQQRSPYRPYFTWAIMPTVDSDPLQEQWVSTYLDADAVFTYSEYGRDTLLKESNNKVNFIDVASPGANLEVLKPVFSKEKHKSDFGFESNINIIGTVMRNQARKLYPDLLEAFSLFISENPELAENTYLYFHTSYPDSMGWDIPMLLRKTGLSNKVLFTYKCEACKYIFPSFFQDAKTVCRKCGNNAAHLPNTKYGLTDQEMGIIYNLFDLYVQYSVCEGFGMPQVEAAACGVPFMAVDYSAMSSILNNLGGIPIKVERMFWDVGTSSKRALPDNKHFSDTLAAFLKKPSSVRQKLGRNHLNKVKEIYNYDRIAKIWENYFDSVELKDIKETWESPPRINNPNLNIPKGMNNEEFIRWCIVNIWGEPKHLNSYTAMKMLRDLNYGEAIHGAGGEFFNDASYLAASRKYATFGYNEAVNNFINMAEKRNYFERLRVGHITEPKPEFIKRVKPDEREQN